MPDNWTNFDFKRKKSCILSNVYSTCVTKAINHLEALQDSIDKWFLIFLQKLNFSNKNVFKYNKNDKRMNQLDKALPSSQTSAESSKRFLNYVKQKSSIKNKSSLNLKQELRFNEKVFIEDSSSSLVVNGRGADISKTSDDKSQMVVIENQAPIDDLRAGGVLEEILLLIARLEHDRKRTESLLKRERQNLNMLKGHIENLALKRAVELPLKVQHEHDACITDITELNWHISFNSKAERKLLRKVEIEERLHKHLTEEIATIKNNTPLIEEKIKTELTLIEKILSAQRDVDEFVNKSKNRLAATQDKSEASYSKAAKEREAIQADLSSCKRELNKAK